MSIFHIFTDELPKLAKNYFCINHITPWCVEYDSPTYYCKCRYCRRLPEEWLEVGETCTYCKPGQYDYNDYYYITE